MKLLLDTHTFLWLVEGSPNLSASASTALSDPANELSLSVASIWELAIKITNSGFLCPVRWTHSSPSGRSPINSTFWRSTPGMPLLSSGCRTTIRTL